MSFANELKDDSMEILNKILEHEFIQEISNDTTKREIYFLFED